ncbi:polysaccharide deacetylase family protein [Formosa maritima]|uniref:Polysaccharide deacetylase family protein n=1 Tax=Formosa maritima TaxID=2592046 RepID=A0A5D0G8D2_9FLAO|nr:polysaccharide deacetylase family protein [Formosa maritima]TYA55198.1 polysaccharide deacetylase family protein [Formosa maritima]
MAFIPAKIPLIIKRIFPKYIWNMSLEENVIYLTFDDGPTPTVTDWTLDVLKQFNAKATFFCIGDNVQKHPNIFQKILNHGHAIGNHTFNHPNGRKTKTQDYLENVKQAQEIITSQIQESKTINHQPSIVNLFRPPYGQITKDQGRKLIKLGYNIIMWSVLAFDWTSKTSKEKCYKNVVNNTKNGSIVVFHDSDKASENMMFALPKMLEHFSKKGFKFQALNLNPK